MNETASLAALARPVQVRCPVCRREVDTFRRPDSEQLLLMGHRTTASIPGHPFAEARVWCSGGGALSGERAVGPVGRRRDPQQTLSAESSTAPEDA